MKFYTRQRSLSHLAASSVRQGSHTSGSASAARKKNLKLPSAELKRSVTKRTKRCYDSNGYRYRINWRVFCTGAERQGTCKKTHWCGCRSGSPAEGPVSWIG